MKARPKDRTTDTPQALNIRTTDGTPTGKLFVDNLDEKTIKRHLDMAPSKYGCSLDYKETRDKCNLVTFNNARVAFRAGWESWRNKIQLHLGGMKVFPRRFEHQLCGVEYQKKLTEVGDKSSNMLNNDCLRRAFQFLRILGKVRIERGNLKEGMHFGAGQG